LAIAFAALGSARTTRQGRGQANLGALIALIVLRIAGFGSTSFAVRSPAGVWMMYAVPIIATVAGTYLAFRSFRPRTFPAWTQIDWSALGQRALALLPIRRKAMP